MVRTKWFISASAAVYAFCGFVLLFLPQEFFTHSVVAANAVNVLIAQILGAALLGLAAANWTARGSLLGGIYGRAIVNGNFCFAFISSMITIRALFSGDAPIWLWSLAAVSVLFALSFGYLLFGKH